VAKKRRILLPETAAGISNFHVPGLDALGLTKYRAFMLPKTVARVARFRNIKPNNNQKQQTRANNNKIPQTRTHSGKEAHPPSAGGGTRTRTLLSE
jgi:hypothetical protein